MTLWGPVAHAENVTPKFEWPSNPFGYSLSDELFPETQEYRFEKAVRVLGEAGGGIGTDLFDIATFPLRDPATFGIFATGLAAMTLVDVPTTTAYQAAVAPLGRRFALPSIDYLPLASSDGEYMIAGLGGTYLYGLATNDERAQVAAVLSTKAIAYSYLTSQLVLKPLFGRSRPDRNLANPSGSIDVFSTNPYEFFQSTGGIPFRGGAAGTAMPSFHFTMYFATARVYAGVYDNAWIPYTVAAALALNSADGHNHWVSDMAAGALIGTGIGNVVMSNYADRKRKRLGMVVPYVSRDGVGAAFHMSF